MVNLVFHFSTAFFIFLGFPYISSLPQQAFLSLLDKIEVSRNLVLDKKENAVYNKNNRLPEVLRMSYYSKFQELKAASMKVAYLYDEIEEYERAQNLRECGTSLLFGHKSTGQSDLIYGNFCKDRFCPHCMYRLMLKKVANLNKAVDAVGGQYIMLTLTVPNVHAVDLGDTIKRLTHAFCDFYRDPRFKGKFKGYQRNIEVTYNSKTFMFHPHIHCILNVDDDYFNFTGKYVDREEVLKIWRNYYHDQSITMVDIRRIKGDNLKQSVVEVCKYVTKLSDFIDKKEGAFVLRVLRHALHKVKTTTYGGTIAKALRSIKEQDIELEERNWKDEIIQNANFV